MDTTAPIKAISEAAERLASKLSENKVETAPAVEVKVEASEGSFDDVFNDTEEKKEEAPKLEKAKKAKKEIKAEESSLDKKSKTEPAELKNKVNAPSDNTEVSNVEDDSIDEFMSYINDNEESSVELKTDDPSTQEINKKFEELEIKEKEYEAILQDPLVEAFAEFVRSGKTDVAEFAKQVGSMSVNEMDIESMYRERATEMGFEGDDIDDAVFEQLDKYNSMTRIEKKDEESRLRSVYKSKSAERLKSFTERSANSRVSEELRVNTLVETADKELDDVLNKMSGKRWKSLVIDDNMINTIRDTIPAMAPLMGKFDGNNKLVGFDVKDGIEMAVWKLYGKQLLKSTFDIGRTSGFDEAMNERIRPTNTNGAAAAPTVGVRSSDDDVTAARQEVAKRTNGRRSLADIFGK